MCGIAFQVVGGMPLNGDLDNHHAMVHTVHGANVIEDDAIADFGLEVVHERDDPLAFEWLPIFGVIFLEVNDVVEKNFLSVDDEEHAWRSMTFLPLEMVLQGVFGQGEDVMVLD